MNNINNMDKNMDNILNEKNKDIRNKVSEIHDKLKFNNNISIDVENFDTHDIIKIESIFNDLNYNLSDKSKSLGYISFMGCKKNNFLSRYFHNPSLSKYGSDMTKMNLMKCHDYEKQNTNEFNKTYKFLLTKCFQKINNQLNDNKPADVQCNFPDLITNYSKTNRIQNDLSKVYKIDPNMIHVSNDMNPTKYNIKFPL